MKNIVDFTIERINSRLTTDAKNVIKQAANLLGLSVSSFMIQFFFERANDLLKSNNELKNLDDADRDMLMSLNRARMRNSP